MADEKLEQDAQQPEQPKEEPKEEPKENEKKTGDEDMVSRLAELEKKFESAMQDNESKKKEIAGLNRRNSEVENMLEELKTQHMTEEEKQKHKNYSTALMTHLGMVQKPNIH